MSPVRSSWLLSFADMLSILLCFLVLAYSFAAAPEEKSARGIEAVRSYFGAEAETIAVPTIEGQRARSGNYWATWIGARLTAVPELSALQVAAVGNAARISLDEVASPLAAADMEKLVEILNSSGADIAVRVRATADSPVAWGEAATLGRQWKEQLLTAGIVREPQIIIALGGPRIAIESVERGV